MTICYHDALGYVEVTVDEYGISFSEGYAIFSDGEHDYRIPVEHLDMVEVHR